MKRLITLAIALIAAATLSAKEIVKNPVTGMTLSENLGVYTITGKSGAIILGTKDQAKEFLLSAHKAILKETLNDIFDCGRDQFEVLSDDQGYYVVKVGLGAVKIRYSDTLTFGTALGLKNLEPAAKNLWSKTQNAVGKLIDKM